MAHTLARLAIFDLDHTLLNGDTDTLWCDYLLQRNLLPAHFAQDNLRLQAQYRSGEVSAQDFSAFYARTLAGFAPQALLQMRAQFTEQVIAPRIQPQAKQLLTQHRQRGDVLVLSSATSHFLITQTAQWLGFEHWIGTTLQTDANGGFTGHTEGVLNMREGKVTRLRAWLQAQHWSDEPMLWKQASFYSDSINDLPLLQAVGHPVAVDPDPVLRQIALDRQWPILSLS